MKLWASILTVTIFTAACVAPPAVHAPACEQPAPLNGKWDRKAPGYIVMFTEDVVDARSLAYELGDEHGFTPHGIYGASKGFSVSELSPRALADLRCERQIRGVWFDEHMRISSRAL